MWMFHSRILDNKINKLNERSLRFVYNYQTSTFQELLNIDNSVSIYDMYKVENNLSPSFIKSIFPLSKNPYHLRNKQTFDTENILTVSYDSETISFRGPKTWALVPEQIKNSPNLKEFKAKIKKWKPQGYSCRLCKTYIAILCFL